MTSYEAAMLQLTSALVMDKIASSGEEKRKAKQMGLNGLEAAQRAFEEYLAELLSENSGTR